MSSRRSGGAAIVLAMLLAAFAAVVAATVLADQQRWTSNVTHRRDQVQGTTIALAGLQWARQILYDDARTSVIDHLGEPWALTLPPIPLDNGEIRGAIVDAQSRLNINALGEVGSGTERMRIARLFAQQHGPAGALDAIADWIDRDDSARLQGAEDAWYARQTPPILAANSAVVRVAELASVRGVSLDALQAVRPFVSALPLHTSVNVNTAPPEVLAAILENASTDAIQAIVSGRSKKPFTTVAEFRARMPEGVTLSNEEALDVKSRFFEVTVEARQGSTVTRARALLRREAGRWPDVVWQVVE